MGTWDAGPFDNDEAGDWAYDFEGADAVTGLGLVRTALDLGGPDEYLGYDEGVCAVAAAAVVSWLQDPSAIPDSPYGEDAAHWVRSVGASPDDALKVAALAALDRVRSDKSELASSGRMGTAPPPGCSPWTRSQRVFAERVTVFAAGTFG